MLYVGIDPGFSGGIAVLENGKLEVWDMPTLQIGDKNELDRRELLSILRELQDKSGGEIIVGLEKVHAQPRMSQGGKEVKMGAASMFSFGRGYGNIEMALDALDISYERIPSQTWKKAMMHGMPKEKQASVAKVRELLPVYADVYFKHKTKTGRADAALIALYMQKWEDYYYGYSGKIFLAVNKAKKVPFMSV